MIENGLARGQPHTDDMFYVLSSIEELGISQARLARAIGVLAMRVSHVVNGTRPAFEESTIRGEILA